MTAPAPGARSVGASLRYGTGVVVEAPLAAARARLRGYADLLLCCAVVPLLMCLRPRSCYRMLAGLDTHEFGPPSNR